MEPDLPPTYALDPSFPRPSGIRFGAVSWVARDPLSGLVYVLQRSQPPVSAWTADGALASAWSTQDLGDPHSLSLLAGPEGTMLAWVTDMAPPRLAGQGYGHCLKAFSLSGTLLATIGRCAADSQGTGLDPVQFDKVTDVAGDAAGHLLVTDGDLDGLNNRLLKLGADGKVLASWSAPGDQPGSGPCQFNLPHALAVDRCGRIWVADTLNHRVQVIGGDGQYHGELASFGGLGVYAVAFGPSLGPPAQSILFVGASPTSGGGTGTVFLFAVPMDCAQPDVGGLAPFASFDVPIPASESVALLHSLAVDPETWDVYLAFLGDDIPPQRWVASWPHGRRPGPGPARASHADPPSRT
jgi:DNA-binding beta-propeller fold protein YncE